MSNSNRMFDIRALGGFKSNDMRFEDFVRNVAKSGVSAGNAYMGKVSFAGGLPEAYTEGTMTVMILSDGLVKYIFNAPSVPYGQYECYSKDGGEPTGWSAGSGGGVADLMVETTYGELKSLRDSGGLVPGMQYRITDYECTTAMGSTRSANHQFDIIVTADTETVLNENARAINHYEDYFADSSLKSWEIKYCLDNDTNRFDWALDGIQPAPSLTAFLFWEDEEGEEYVYTHYEVNEEYIEWWEEVLNSTEEDEQVPRRGAKASGQHVFTGVNSEYDGGVYNASDLKNHVGKIKEMKVEEQPTKAFLTWWYKDDEGKQQYVTFYECKIDEKAGLIYWHNGDSSVYQECYTYTKLAVWSGKDYPETLVYSDGSFKTSIGYIGQYSLPSAKKGTLDWKDGDTDRTYNSYYVYNNGANKRVVAWTGEDISDKQEGDYGQNIVYTYCRPSDYSETDPQESGYVYSSDSLDDRTLLRSPANIGTISDFDMPVIPAEETRGVVLRETAESEPTYITGKGVIYYMKDEYGNECPYDFKNIQYVIGEKVFYTFNVWNDELQSNDDDSTVGYGECYGNVIKPNKNSLNFITFSDNCHNNTFGNNCVYNTFDNNCQFNTFGNNCQNNTFGSNFIYNTFGDNCGDNTFGNNCQNNTFGNICMYINLSSNFDANTFENIVSCLSLSSSYTVSDMTVISGYYDNISYIIPQITKNFWLGLNYAKDAIQIAEYWPSSILYIDAVDSESTTPIVKPECCYRYTFEQPLTSLTVSTSVDDRNNFEVNFTAGEDFTISLPVGARYVGINECISEASYQIMHGDNGIYYIGKIFTA